MHLWKFWLCWLWQRIMSDFEDFKNIWGISSHFSPHEVSFKKSIDYVKKILVSAELQLS